MTNLDTTFNYPNGFATTNFGFTTPISFARSIIIQPNDNKIIIAGETLDNNPTNIIALARYNTNGTLDNSFGTGGLATASISGSSGLTNMGLTLHNGKIYVCGFYNPPSISFFHIYIACFTSTGILDSNFGTSGIQTISPTSFNSSGLIFDNCYSSAIEIDTSIFPNKLVICGYTSKISPSPNRNYVALARLDILSGLLDSSFGSNGTGLVAFNFNSLADEYANSLVISNSGDYLLSGFEQISLLQNITVYKFDTFGFPITTFGLNGKKVIPNILSGTSGYGSSIKIQQDLKIVVGGSSTDIATSDTSYEIVRLDPLTGALDPSFGTGGIVLTNLSPSINLTGNSIALQTDGKIVIGGYFYNYNPDDSFSLARYDTNGVLDTTFGISGNGLINEDIIPSPLREHGYSVAIQSDGKILLGGVVGEFSDQSDLKSFILARYLSFESPTPSPTPTPTPSPTPTPTPTPSPTPSPSPLLPTPIVPICFPAGTFVSTDQGDIPIELIDPNFHTICNENIVAVTETIMMEKYIVCIEKNAFGYNMPDKKTFITKYHCIKYNNKLIEAYRFIGRLRGVYYVKYNGELLYNILMNKHYVININNLKVETLYPKNVIARLYTNNYSLQEKKNIILKMNEETIKKYNSNKNQNDIINNNNYNKLRHVIHTRKAYHQNNYLIGRVHNKTIRNFHMTNPVNYNSNYSNIFSRKHNIINRSHYMGKTNKRFRR
jgi:uncharacterized delta-60 repeat protein